MTSDGAQTIMLPGGDADASTDGKKRKVRSIVMHPAGEGEAGIHKFSFTMPSFGHDEKELRAALADQGIKGAKADAVIAKLRKNRAEAIRKQSMWIDRDAARADADADRAEAGAERAAAQAMREAMRAEVQAERAA
ncbi:MAG: hypothetical protein HC788_14400, partial [Sphingopyxis sp.]|nr:hypothetical protein [Sphingopyxis sp.]